MRTRLQLPRFSIPPKYSGGSGKLRQRSHERFLTLTTANSCLNSIEGLSSALDRDLPNLFDPPRPVSSSPCVGVYGLQNFSSSKSRDYIPNVFSTSNSPLNRGQQDRILQFVLSAAKRFVRRAKLGSDGGKSFAFGYTQSSLAVPLVARKVSLPDVAGVVPLLDLLPRALATSLAQPSPDLIKAEN